MFVFFFLEVIWRGVILFYIMERLNKSMLGRIGYDGEDFVLEGITEVVIYVVI